MHIYILLLAVISGVLGFISAFYFKKVINTGGYIEIIFAIFGFGGSLLLIDFYKQIFETIKPELKFIAVCISVISFVSIGYIANRLIKKAK